MAKKVLSLKFGDCDLQTGLPVSLGSSSKQVEYVYTGIEIVNQHHADELPTPGEGLSPENAIYVATSYDWELIQVLLDPLTGKIAWMFFKHE